MNVGSLFQPASIAVVGASRAPEKIGHQVLVNLRPFDGTIHPVNPSAEGEIFGREFVASVTEIDDDVDLALVAVPAPVVPDVIEECAAAGVDAAVIYAGGFAEAGPEGEDRQDRVVETATDHGMAVLGPNTSGFVIPGDGLCGSFASGVEEVPAGGTCVIAQSGGVAHSLAFQTLREGRGLSAMVGLGNRATVGFPEAIGHFDDHAATDAIVLHVEGTDRGRELLEASRAADTPVIAYKVGESDVGAFAESHTGALTGDHELYLAGFEQYGIPTVESTRELLDGAAVLGDGPLPAGPNVGVITAQAGPGIIIADRIQRSGGRLPELADATSEEIAGILPGITYAENPIDTGRPMPEFGDVVAAVAADDAVDVVLVNELYEDALGLPVDRMRSLVETVEKPIVFATDGPPADFEDDVAALEEMGIPVFHSPERAADVVSLLARYGALADGGRQEPNDERQEPSDDGTADSTGVNADV
ncbi:CoA-binding protein [Halopenitus persicus]|uniref:acetate--CoA ligase (ADP-forming) n=1 Tax=Halopenitus persicus TaxID=1048396 RepID=A0A1H3K096_9EURY|nr:CoA-binding protein [Halopenitus persicus]SDY45607.1 acetyltransferase [Halopenitus persicus]